MLTTPSSSLARTAASQASRPYARHLAALGLAALLGALTTPSHAQNADAFAPDTILTAAQQMLQQIDGKQGNALYEQAPAFVKSAMKKNAFAKGIAQERSKMGALTARQWVSITRIVTTPAPNHPPVACTNVRFAALQQNALAGFEQVSLCLDQQQWRPTGYVANTQ